VQRPGGEFRELVKNPIVTMPCEKGRYLRVLLTVGIKEWRRIKKGLRPDGGDLNKTGLIKKI